MDISIQRRVNATVGWATLFLMVLSWTGCETTPSSTESSESSVNSAANTIDSEMTSSVAAAGGSTSNRAAEEVEVEVKKTRPILEPTQEALSFLTNPPPAIDSETPGMESLEMIGVLQQPDLSMRFMVKKTPHAAMVALLDHESNIPNFIAVNQTAMIYNFFDNEVVFLRGVGFNFRIYMNDGQVRFECGPKVSLDSDGNRREKEDYFEDVSIDLTDFYRSLPSGNIRFPDRKAMGYMVSTQDDEGNPVMSVVAETPTGPRYVEALIQLQDTVRIGSIDYNPEGPVQIPNLEYVRNDLENSGVKVRIVEMDYLDAEDLALTMSRITWPIYYWKLLDGVNVNDRYFLERELKRKFDWEDLRIQYEFTGSLLNLSVLNTLKQLYPSDADAAAD